MATPFDHKLRARRPGQLTQGKQSLLNILRVGPKEFSWFLQILVLRSNEQLFLCRRRASRQELGDPDLAPNLPAVGCYFS